MEACRDQVKIVLSGDGADEIFGGYHRYLLPYHDEEIRKLVALERYQFLVDKYYGKAEARYARLINRDASQSLEIQQRLEELCEYYFGNVAGLVNGMGILDFYTTMQVLLQMNDRLTMAHSVENRSPFLDYRLIEFGFGLRDHCKIREGRTKWILKKVAENFLPNEIVSRTDKRGFSAPLNRWFGWDKYGKYQRETYKVAAFNDWREVFLGGETNA
jgi:asparagine synthase (glutamine-hydrolysing)